MAAEMEPLGPGTPQAVAVEWVEAVMDRGDLDSAWQLTDDTLRLVLAQDWIWRHRHHPVVGDDEDRDHLAAQLAGDPGEHPLWSRFASDLVAQWHTVWEGFSARTWGVAEQPEVLGLDLEIVTFAETGARGTVGQPGRATFTRRFALRHGPDGWKVASVSGEKLFAPGWPPTLEPLGED